MEKETIKLTPYFISSEEDLYDEINWVKRDAVIKSVTGEVIFQQDGVEFPDFWSDQAVKIVTDKYFRGIVGTDQRETSLKQVVNRVVNTATEWGIEQGYFDEENSKIFNADLKYLIFHQYYSFNSPVWFNVGIEEDPQVSACFIQGVGDTMESIMELAKNEAFIYKGGSGSGTNFSNLRGKDENLSTGGKASGPVSFMRGFDSFAGVIKSGGKTRRAAKMAILDCDHPDITDFVKSKMIEEEKAQALIREGYGAGFEEENSAYKSVFFQNENHTVNVTDEFMHAVEEDGDWLLKPRGMGKEKKIKAKELFLDICKSAHACGDPGLFFEGVSNRYHTCPSSGEIRGSNPCGEYIDIDDSACNLGSLNLKRFISKTENGFVFEIDAFKSAVWLATLAQEIFIDKASYPTEKIGNNARRHRQLGIGYSNLGALLMYCGLPYDSNEGRALAASISSLLTSSVYQMSGWIAGIKGAFEEFEENKYSVRSVLQKHKYNAENKISTELFEIKEIAEVAVDTWNDVIGLSEKNGIRNSKATVLAPTGTISFMMDCDTTSAEPELFLVKTKTLVGGGSITITNNTIGQSLLNLGYSEKVVAKIVNHVETTGTMEGNKLISKEHLPIFDTSYSSSPNGRTIDYSGHIKMLSAIQPYISGGISKTVNLSKNCTIEDVYNAFMMAFKMRCKSITIFREDSKGSQPLTVKRDKEEEKQIVKRSMPSECDAFRHGFNISGHKIYLHTGFFSDGTLGEIFINAAKGGSTMSGFLESIAILTSVSLQYGVPLKALIQKLAHISFEPNGYTGNREIGYAKSIVDYIFRYLDRYVQREDHKKEVEESKPVSEIRKVSSDGPPCSDCGSIMIRRGSCYYCDDCGSSTGCS